MFVEDFFTFLKDQGTSAENRIFPQQVPQGASYPAARYFQVSDPPEHTQSGRSSLRHPRFQVDCYDEDSDGHDGYLGAKQLANEIIGAVDSCRGEMGTTTCYAGFLENARDNYDPETGRHWVTVDFEIWHKEA